jgi:hypothetical protein
MVNEATADEKGLLERGLHFDDCESEYERLD